MSNKEISIVGYKIENCEGNLKQLSEIWAAVPKLQNGALPKSKGDSVETIRKCCQLTSPVRVAMSSLLNNSIEFLLDLGQSFKNSDSESANIINEHIR